MLTIDEKRAQLEYDIQEWESETVEQYAKVVWEEYIEKMSDAEVMKAYLSHFGADPDE